MPHLVEGVLGVLLATFNQWQGDVRVKGELVESSGFLRLNDMVAPIHVWMGTFHG